jgi:energy-coupling factor transporter ATP-binding protein EcfA2
MSQLDYFKYELSNSKWNKTKESLNILQTEGKLILIIGNNGSGKTLLLIFITSISDKPVLSNFKINHPN